MKKTTSYSTIIKGLFVLTLFISISSLNSCDKDDPAPDPCENITCLNGGTCDDGNCDCPDGYSGTNCETYDECHNVTCLNGGVCVNGDCDCADGYSGPSCADQITPTKVRISKIKITSFPQYDGGSSWDVGSGPDIYIYITKGSTVIHEQPTMFENADSSIDYTYTPSTYIDITDVTAQHGISLYDYDSGSDDDFMGGILFYPYHDTNEFPTTMNLDAGAGITFELTLSYVW